MLFRENIKMEITQSQCAQITLIMINAFKEYLEKPSFALLTFEDWLQKLIELDTSTSEYALSVEKK